MKMDMLTWLENWYESQCDGEWEHNDGIEIKTIDNPGWSINIYLVDTNVNIIDVTPILIEINEYRWVSYSIDKGYFIAYGGTYDLNILIRIFKLLVDNGEIDEQTVRGYLNDTKPDKFNDI